MGIFIRLFKFLGVKIVTVCLIILTIITVGILIDSAKDNYKKIENSNAISKQLKNYSNYTSAENLRNEKNNELSKLENKKPPIYKPVDRFTWSGEYKRKEWEYDTRIAGAELLDKDHQQQKQAYEEARKEISPWIIASEESYVKNQNTIWLVIFFFLFAPVMWKFSWYYIIARLVSRSRAVRLHKEGKEDISKITINPGAKECRITLKPGEKILCRMEWVQQYPPTVKKRTRLIWKWRMPFMSYAAGLSEMTEWETTNTNGDDCLVLASGEDPNVYIARIDIEDHPGISLKPTSIVAISSSVNPRSKWVLRSIHSWVSGRLRHILFRGTGTIFVCGCGGVSPIIPNSDYRIDEALVFGFESQVQFSTARTETFWPYFRNKVSLFDYRFSGDRHVFVQQALPVSERKKNNPFIRVVDGILGGIGKLLGF